MSDKIEQDAEKAKNSFTEHKSELLPVYEYLVPKVYKIHETNEEYQNFQEAFDHINTEMSIQEVAIELAKCKRENSLNASKSFLESLKIFIEIEAKIRFTIWPNGINAPHHFSKLLLLNDVKDVFSEKEIICILAVFADPKGLNLRNIATHGLSLNTSLSLPLLRGLSSFVLSKLSQYEEENPKKHFQPPFFDFKRELELLKFSSYYIDIPNKLLGYSEHRFQLLDEKRKQTLLLAYQYFNDEKYVDSLLLLFPILEHSLRRAAVCIMDLPWDRLCASSNDHFLSVPEALDVLPLPIKNMGTDLLFAPDGPRIRDRIMHGFIQDIPKEFAFCIFALFEKCNIYFDNDDINSIGKWDFAFHPARCLEYELSLCCSELSGLYIDLLRTYNQQIFERLIECAIAIKSIQNKWKDDHMHSLFENNFQRFLCLCILYLTINKNVKNGTIQHISGMVQSILKMEAINDVRRFQIACEKRIKLIKKFFPFLPSNFSCSFIDLEEVINDDELFTTSFQTFLHNLEEKSSS